MNNADSSPNPPLGSRRYNPEEAEQFLLLQLDQNPAEREAALLNLASFYSQAGRHDEAIRRFRELLHLITDVERKAACVLAIGGTAEAANDYESAVRYYREAMAFEPASSEAWYFIHNNLGYSLNQLGRFSEGASYCRTAIGFLPERPNAHKNLGLALAGLGRWREAAQCFIEATRVRPTDQRSCAHLEDLLEERPELKAEFGRQVLECRAAVTTAMLEQQQRQARS